MNLIFLAGQILFVVGVGQRAATAKIPMGCADAPHGRRQRGTPSGPSPSSSENTEVAGPPVNYWFKTGVVDEGRGFMQGRAETKQGDQVVGSYQYSDGHVKVKVVYTADERGYRVLKEERVTLKPFTKNEIPYKKANENRRPVSSVHRKKVPFKSTYKDKNEPHGKYSSSYAAETSQGLILANLDGYDVKTNHGTGYSHQGFSSKPAKSQKYKIQGEETAQHKQKTRFSGTSRRPLINHNDQYNLSLEIMDDLVNKPSHMTGTRANFGSNSRGKSKYANRSPKIKQLPESASSDSLAFFVRNPRPSKPLFKPYERKDSSSVGDLSRTPFFKPISARPARMKN